MFEHTPHDLKLRQTIQTPAILDQKWCHNQINNDSTLAVVNADGQLEIYRLNNDIQLELCCAINIKEINSLNELLLLSLDWCTGKFGSNEPELVVSDSKGCVYLIKLSNNTLDLLTKWDGHTYEAWIAAFYYWDTNIVFSGGDDCLFMKYDRRIDCSKPIIKNRAHQAGVTAFHSNKSKEFIVVTGRLTLITFHIKFYCKC